MVVVNEFDMVSPEPLLVTLNAWTCLTVKAVVVVVVAAVVDRVEGMIGFGVEHFWHWRQTGHSLGCGTGGQVGQRLGGGHVGGEGEVGQVLGLGHGIFVGHVTHLRLAGHVGQLGQDGISGQVGHGLHGARVGGHAEVLHAGQVGGAG